MRVWVIGAGIGAAALATGYLALRPTGGVANDAGEPVLRPVFNSALRDSIREDVREGGGVIDAHRPADTSLWNSRNVEDTQQEQGSARLGRRYGT